MFDGWKLILWVIKYMDVNFSYLFICSCLVTRLLDPVFLFGDLVVD